MAFCASCGAQLSDSSGTCPACGRSTTATSVASTPAAANLADNVAGMLSYITIIPAILFLLIEPYNKRRFIRFHAFQCLFLALACVLAGIALRIFAMLPMIGLAALLLWPVLWLVEVVAWLACLIKAYQGKMFKLPVIGDLAEKQTPPETEAGQIRAA